MITLSLVSTSGLYKDLEHDKFHYNDGNATRVIELLEQNSIKNYDQLAKLLNSGAISDDYAYSYLARKLNYISDRIRKANAKNMQYEIFTFPETLGDEVDAETLRITDEKSLGKVLLCPYINPISYMGYAHGGTKWPHIKGRSVSNIKELLGALNKDTLGNEISSCRKMGKKSTQQLVTAIGLYHEQILRQAQVTQERGIDLFSYQHMEKIRGVEEFFPTVVEQLIETTTATIWGPITPTQIKKLTMAVKSIGLNGESQLLRDYLNETLANYSTLPEVSNFASEEVRARVLKRIGPVRN